MIARLLDAVHQRVQDADAWTATDDSVTVMLSEQGAQVAGAVASAAHLRVGIAGRIGTAFRRDAEAGPLIEAALASADGGLEAALQLPGPSPHAVVQTAWPAAAGLDARDLADLAAGLRQRLLRDGRSVSTWGERSTGRVEVGNSRGVHAGYDATLVGIGLHVRVETPTGPLGVRLHHTSADPPGSAVLDRLAAEVEARLVLPAGSADPAAGATTLWLAPRAVRALVTPLGQALHAEWLLDPRPHDGARMGHRILPETLTLLDEPLLPGRPGSRPVDDEGVVCRRQALVERGVVRGWLADLVTAERHGLPASGHAWREGPGAPRAGWSNVVLEPGATARKDLPDLAGDGILIRDLPTPTGHVADGRVSLTTPWAYRLRAGEPVERLERFTLQGNVYEMLGRVAAVGDEVEWWGAAGMPDLVLTRPVALDLG